ncbi:MAG: zinc-binding dehydrogenase [Reyranella sp.]|jgi:alcohol dehydrogenase|nr:zinc-binding dehydrogenase [Reyranella sp.]MBL6650243.1 zinc-binding dehydrogenase [Reyranella sp.]
MKAAVLKALGSPLAVETVPDPVLGTGEVIVDVAATKVLAYAGDVLSGQRRYLLEPPIVPGAGCIGRVREVGPDATELAPGDWVFCDPTVRSRDNAQAPDIILQGLTAGSQRALRLQKYFHDGSWAERTRVPTECVVRIGAISDAEAVSWCAFGNFAVAYGGYVAANLQPGETVLVNGATGAFGSGGVAVALAMGASTVIATGRNQQALDDLARRFGKRVRPVRMAGDEERDRQAILDLAGAPIDCVLDLLPPAATPAQVRAALLTVRPYGRVVLMGGVRQDVGVPYDWLMRHCITIHGQWMYRRDAIPRLIALVRSGLLSLEHHQAKCFGLDDVNEAIAHAAAHAGPFSMTVLRP